MQRGSEKCKGIKEKLVKGVSWRKSVDLSVSLLDNGMSLLSKL